MRIAGLHLRAYGHFTDCSLDLGAAPGLHVIYGHNEAGKSTTLRALSSVLFGYPHEVVDGFKHDAKDIAIGIDLVAADGRALSFVRRRRGRRTLTDADGAAIEDGAVEQFLGGVSRDVFEKVFALDHDRLRAHAQALLADGGSLGFSLVEAGSGIAGLKAALDNLRAERAGLFLATGTKPKLNQAITEFVRLRKEAKQHTVSPAEYRSHEKRVQETEAELQRTRERLKDIESDAVRLQRIRKNLPLRAEHRVLTQRIEALDGVPVLPPEFGQQRVKALTDFDAAREDIAVASAAVDNLECRVAAISIDADVLARSEDVENLAQKRPIIERQEAERPRREAERAELLARTAELIAKAELDGGAVDPNGALPSVRKRKAIQALADAGKALKTQRATLRERAEFAAHALSEARGSVEQTPKPRPVGELSRVLTAADKLGSDITADIARRTRALERKTKALNETITSLGLRTGDQILLPGISAVPTANIGGIDRVAQLRELAIPSEKTEARYASALTELDHKIKDAGDNFERLNGELAGIDKRIVAIKTKGDVATEDDLKEARNARDDGWALVRGLFVERRPGLTDAARRFAPDGRIAETYEAYVSEADRAVDTLRARVQESTELAFLRRQVGDLETKKTEEAQNLDVLGARRDVLLSEWHALWPAGLIAVQPPGEMIGWMVRRNTALATADELEEERDTIRGLLDKEGEARRSLAAAIAAVITETPEGSLDTLREQARCIIADAADVKSRRDRAETAVRGKVEQKAQADDAVGRVESRVKEWTAAWRMALTEAGLPSDLTVEAAAATLEIIAELDGIKSKIDGLSQRIETMRTDRDAFGAAVAGIAAALSDSPTGTAAEVCRWLEERLRRARHAELERRSLAEQLESRAADHDRASDKIARSTAALDALFAQAGCADADELAETERQSAEKRDALREREKIERRVREDGGGRDFAVLFEECDDVPGDRIAADLVGLEADRADTETRVDQLMSERAKLRAEFEALLGQNQAADRAQEAAAVQAEIEDGVEAYVDLTVQETLLRTAIEVYRDRNQGPILRRARDLFVQLTDGAYAGLRADIDGGKTMLIVEDAGRGSLEIKALSDGTADAVYLALRLAVVQEHNATHEPLPFIADDLLLNLDNHRAKAALRTLATLAASGQVLLFTHHAHMVELARSAVPSGILVEHSLSPLAGKAEGSRAAAG